MKFFREYRFLIIVYGLTLIAALWELYRQESANSSPGGRPEYIGILATLYPEAAKTHFYDGVDALFVKNNPAEARRQFEHAIGMGMKTEEQLLYYYVGSLVLDGADQSLIDEAAANWRRNHPRSTEPDPRTLPWSNMTAKRAR